MHTRTSGPFWMSALLLLLLASGTVGAETKSRTPARVLAKQTGATQFEEERFEPHTDCNDHKHHLKKRSSDEDVDYEVYQGVVGRPGIDFPIYPRIPKTSFSCRSFGNGYFADMETDCQVFHICEEGRKISFLCPNGTIFQQSELTCDWWFKVNCLGSQGFYAESAEILNKQRVHRVRPSVPVQGFNIVGGSSNGALDIKPKHTNSNNRNSLSRNRLNSNNNNTPRSRNVMKSERRMDSNEQPSLESVDFEDISSEKQLKGQHPKKQLSNIETNSNDQEPESQDHDQEHETQVAAESASFVGGKRRNSYTYEKPGSDGDRKSSGSSSSSNGKSSTTSASASRRGSGDRGSQRHGYQNTNNESTERSRGTTRGQHRFRGEEKKPTAESFERTSSEERKKSSVLPEKLILPIVPVEVAGRSNNRVDITAEAEAVEPALTEAEPEVKPEFYEPPVTRSSPQPKATTPTYSPGTYSTARRLDSTRTTPFYTPTIPSVAKSRTTEGKSFYAKGSGSGAATTPTPNRFNAGSSLVLESSAGPRATVEPKGTIDRKATIDTKATINNKATIDTSDLKDTIDPKATIDLKSKVKTESSTESRTSGSTATTLRPFIIGMRHHYDNSPEVHRISISSKSHLNVELPVKKANGKAKAKDSKEDLLALTTTTTPPTPTTGPTYLPKSAASVPRSSAGSGGDLLLFAPPSVATKEEDDESVSRNVNDMLKTMSLLQDTIGGGSGDKLRDVEVIKFPGQSRAGLEIPPSSGPDALVSLAKYFAGEQIESTANALNSVDAVADKPHKSSSATSTSTLGSVSNMALKPAPVSTIATISTAASPLVHADDIQAGLLSQKTVNKYANLFGLRDAQGRQQVADPSEGLLSHTNKDAEAQAKDHVISSPFPQIGSTDATIRELAEKPESRKIAQVFSSALTTYLEDPKSFRAKLESARPTEPPPVGGRTANFETTEKNFQAATTTVKNFQAVTTTTDSTLFRSGTAASYLPTRPTPAFDLSTTTETPNIAVEINDKFDSSTPTVDLASTTEVDDSTTTTSNFRFTDSREQKQRLELSAELLPPSPESGEGEEFLLREQTQSFVKSRNDLAARSGAKKASKKASHSAFVIDDVKPTETPWNHISQTDFLDPLTINDGLMKEQRTTTASPYTYLPKQETTPSPYTYLPKETTPSPYTYLPKETTPSPYTYLPKETTTIPTTTTAEARSSGIEFARGSGSRRRLNDDGDSKAEQQQQRSSQLRLAQEPDSWHEIFNSYDLPRETLPSSSGLQRIANKLFGGLNETEALHLKNVMQQAEHNRQVLSLLLLLIQTCDDQNGKALERSRKHLLNALIDMDGKLQKEGKSAHHKANKESSSSRSSDSSNISSSSSSSSNGSSSSTSTTTSRVPVTTYRRSSEDFQAISTTPSFVYPSTTTDLPASTTTESSSSLEETTKFEIRVVDFEEDLTSTVAPSGAGGGDQLAHSSDKRALELLKSLYSLASKFTSRR